jgi:hypothetical protein
MRSRKYVDVWLTRLYVLHPENIMLLAAQSLYDVPAEALIR